MAMLFFTPPCTGSSLLSSAAGACDKRGQRAGSQLKRTILIQYFISGDVTLTNWPRWVVGFPMIYRECLHSTTFSINNVQLLWHFNELFAFIMITICFALMHCLKRIYNNLEIHMNYIYDKISPSAENQVFYG